MKKLVATLGLVSIAVLGLQVPAAVAGGNWLEFVRAESPQQRNKSGWDVFAVGESLVARVGYLRSLSPTDDRPLHLRIERGQAIEPGAPIPASAITVATFEMAPDRTRGSAAFVLPHVPSGTYSLSVCDDPCTERGFGFGESVQGWLTVVQSPGEVRLLTRVRELRETLRTRDHGLRAGLRRTEREERRLRDALGTVRSDLTATRAHVDRLISFAASGRSASRPDRDLVDGGAGAWIASGLVIAALIIRRRRGPRIVVPDTPAELLTEDPLSVER